MQRLALVMLVATALAGCSDGNGGGSDGDHNGHTPTSVAEAPVWARGDWWSVTDNMDRSYSIVVAGESGSDWTVLSNDLSVALADYDFDISYLGAVGKADLAGRQGADRVKYFEWPLEHEKTWTTRWDGVTRTMVAHDMGDGTWHIQGHDGQTLAVEYTYDPVSKWLTELTFYNATTGELQFGWTSSGSGQDFGGTVYQYDLVETGFSVAQTGVGGPQGTFPVADTVQHVVIDLEIDCDNQPGLILVGLQPPQDDGSESPVPPIPFLAGQEVYGNDEPCPQADGVMQWIVPEPAGTWRFDASVNSSSGGFSLRVTEHTFQAIVL